MWRYVHADELYHFKYIKREKVNGKWKYYYDGDLDRAYEKGTQNTTTNSVTKRTGDNTIQKSTVNTTKRYKDVDSLFSTKEKISSGYSLKSEIEDDKTTDRFTKDEVVEYRRGKIERALADGEKWIFEKFLKKRNR